MNTFLKFGLIGAGGYLLYRQFLGSSEPAAADTTAAAPAAPAATGGYRGGALTSEPVYRTSVITYTGRGSSSAPAGAATGGRGTSAGVSASARDAVVARARAAMGASWDGRLTSHEWNWFYSQVRGVPGPDPGPLFADPLRRMSVEEYWPAISAAGFSGLNYRGGF